MTRAIVLALAASLSIAALAHAAEKPSPEKPEKNAPGAAAPPPADAAVCTPEDAAAEAAQKRKRDAALAELGRRLAAEPPVEGEFRVLGRTGHNYGRIDAPPAARPAAKPAPPAPGADTKPPR